MAEVLHHHHSVEDEALWPVLRRHADGATGSAEDLTMLEDMEAEHGVIDPALAAVRSAFGEMCAHPCTDHRNALEIRIAAARESLHEHLAHEEGQALPMLQRTLSKQENDAFEAAAARGYPLRIVPFVLCWVMHELPDEARRPHPRRAHLPATGSSTDCSVAASSAASGRPSATCERGSGRGQDGAMALLHDHLPGLSIEHLPSRLHADPVRLLDPGLVGGGEVWLKDESTFGDGGWGGNKVRKLEWIIPEAQRRGVRTLFTVGGIGTHWGLAAALYGREHGLRTLLGLVDQPVDDHVREQLARLEASGAELHRYRDPTRLRLAAPGLIAGAMLRDRRLPWYLPAGGSNAFGALAYAETALEIAGQVDAGVLPEPATVVTAVGSGGTAAGLALGLRLAGLRTRVFGVVVNDAFPLDAPVIARLANRTADLLRDRGADRAHREDRGRGCDDAHGLARCDLRGPHSRLDRGRRRRRT